VGYSTKTPAALMLQLAGNNAYPRHLEHNLASRNAQYNNTQHHDLSAHFNLLLNLCSVLLSLPLFSNIHAGTSHPWSIWQHKCPTTEKQTTKNAAFKGYRWLIVQVPQTASEQEANTIQWVLHILLLFCVHPQKLVLLNWPCSKMSNYPASHQC